MVDTQSIAILEFTVLGVPAPKGSTKAFFRKGMKYPVVTADNPKTRPWQQSIVDAARAAMLQTQQLQTQRVFDLGDARQVQPDAWIPLEGPVSVAVRFFLPRPASAPKRVIEPAKKPDGDKLERALWDGLVNAGVMRDDAQITTWRGSKEFAGGETDPSGAAGIPRAIVRVGRGFSWERAL